MTRKPSLPDRTAKPYDWGNQVSYIRADTGEKFVLGNRKQSCLNCGTVRVSYVTRYEDGKIICSLLCEKCGLCVLELELKEIST